LHSQRGRWILYPYEIAENESEYLCNFIGNSTYKLFHPDKRIIDRLFFDGQTYWIIDYKSSRLPSEEDLTDFYERKAKKYRWQLVTYCKILRENQAKKYPIRAALYFPLVEGGEGWKEIS
ncbi:PD-(D/E)XK nuclease family protein, partial [bacterium]|nr:PD-(D/E)XK nuclease family protein [bacterium]